jgi:outer membrane lipoprotein SlyB
MKALGLVLMPLLLAACATNKPVLYSSTGAASGGDAAIAECHNLAVAAGAQPTGQAGTTAREAGRGATIGAASGAVGGAIAGNAASGAGIGAATGVTAALINSIFSSPAPNPAYRAFVERCLRDRGFDPVGWE